MANSVNRYRLNFTSTLTLGLRSEVCLAAGGLYYSWNNISSSYRNNAFTLTWIDGNSAAATMPAGLYQITDIADYFKYVCAQNLWYLIDGDGNPVYYIDMLPNRVYGAAQMFFTALPSALPAGWSYPAGATWTTYSKTAQLTFDSEFGKLIGFNAGTYPASTTYTTGTMSQTASTTLVGVGTTFTASMVGGVVRFDDDTTTLITAFTDVTNLEVAANQTKASQPTNITFNNMTDNVDMISAFTPTLSRVFTVVINCNLIDNNMVSVNSQQLFSLNGVGNVPPRQAIQLTVNEYLWLPVYIPQTQYIEIYLTDQDGNPLEQTDTDASFTIYLKTKKIV
jgi:hypothetical protein